MLAKGNAQKNRILAAGLLMVVGYGLMSNTLGFFAVPVCEAIGCSRASFNFYYTIACVVSLFTAPLFGQILQKSNARHLMLAGTVVGGLAFAGFSLCRTIGQFYIAAFFLGMVHQGTSYVTAIVLVNRAFEDNPGSATGIVMSGTGICSGCMSLILPGFIERAGWQAGYLLQAALWVLVMAIALLLTKNTVEPPRAPAQTHQTHAEEGVTLRQALGRPSFYILFCCFAAQGTATIVVQHIPAFLTELGKSAAETSLIMGVFSVMMIAGKILLGLLYDRLGAARALFVNFLSLALSMWLMIPGAGLLLWLGILLMAFGMASIMVLFPLVTGSVYGKKEYASIWGIVSMASTCGTAVGSPMWGAVYDRFGSYRPAFFAVPVMILVNAAVILLVMAHSGTHVSKS